MTININGIVQGVGFRPFIHKLVMEHGLKGWVKNSSEGVTIDVEGEKNELLSFIDDIQNKKPELSYIESLSYDILNEIKNYKEFKIIKSTESENKFTLISPDVCICKDCLNELFNKNDRRYLFPFINCTNCGPRFTIIKDIPYDRASTTMSDFPMCKECQNEYTDIEDRRYHAQPDCCFDCGPQVFFIDENNNTIYKDPIDLARNYIKQGKIISIKGLGGFHLCCDANNIDTINELRKRKHRDEKPFAVMAKSMEVVEKICKVSEEQRKSLESFRRPIVLLERKDKSLDYISPDNRYIGVMLPYTPIHYLIMQDDIELVIMTSANISDLPIIHKNEDAVTQLKNIADGFLMHNRDIYNRCDDSLIIHFEGKEYPYRRSRGYVPFPIKIKKKVGEILACGAEQKASFALSKDEYVFMSQHIGDMKNLEVLSHYEHQIAHFEKIFAITPKRLICDMHPDYMSTNYAKKISKDYNLDLIYAQHHHAHMASCMADNNINEKVLGIIWDGTGYGTDGKVWGGEFLAGDYSSFERVGSIREIGLPGGDKAIKEIYRVAYALLYDTYGEIPENFIYDDKYQTIIKMLKNNINTPKATSIGRLFDGIAAILNLKQIASYEGQGAIILEGKAKAGVKGFYDYKIEEEENINYFDWRPMIIQILNDLEHNIEVSIIASKFMNTLINAAVKISVIIRDKFQINSIVLSGGVFQNMYILTNLKNALDEYGFKVYTHNRVSTNDEGIALGQLLIGANAK